MNFQRASRRSWVAMLVGAAFTAGLGYVLHDFRIGLALSHLSYDLLPIIRGDVATPSVVLVYLDEKSHKDLGQPFNAPWDRRLHARLIDRLTQAGARAIVFDIVFSDPLINDPAADRILADAMKASGRVILGADNVRIGPKAKKVIRPFDELLDAAAGFGSVEVIPGPDLVVREHTPEEQLPSLSWAAAEFLKAPAIQRQNSRDVPRWLNYYGPPRSLAGVSFSDALNPDQVSSAAFRDKVVFVGAQLVTKFTGERKDEYRSPFTYWTSQAMKEQLGSRFVSGVEIQATAFLNLYRGDWLVRLPFHVERGLMLMLGALLGAFLVRFRPVVATGLALAGWLVTSAFFYILYRQEFIWFPWLVVWSQVLLALCWSVLFNSVELYVEKRVYEHTLALYLPPKLVKRFSSSAKLLKPGAEKQVVTLFFSDIANFTALSEQMDSDELARIMNQYFEAAVTSCIHKTDGTVVKYIGDGIFAFWNAPEPQPDHARRACEAALRFHEMGDHSLNGQRLVTRIGLHTGVANVGNFGSVVRVDYTALGESVNLASRLESLNKHLGTQCLISDATHHAAGAEFITRPVGSFRLKGFERPVDVHELVGWPAAAEDTRAWRDTFAQALDHYRHRHWTEAAAGFRRTIELRSHDSPSNFYLARIAALPSSVLPESWAGEIELGEK